METNCLAFVLKYGGAGWGMHIKCPFLLLLVMSCFAACGDSTKEKRMQKLLADAESLNSRYVAMDTVTYMDEVFDYYNSHGNKNEKMRANYMMGSVFRYRGDSPMALQYLLNAANMADTTDTSCDFGFASKIYAQMMVLLFEDNYYIGTIKFIQK